MPFASWRLQYHPDRHKAPDAEERFEEWRAFFPAGPAGEDYVLLQVVPSRLEVLNFVRQVTPIPFGLRPAVLVRRGDGWVFEEPGDS
jgi:hypothetical protein